MRAATVCLLLTSCAWVTEEELDLLEEDCGCPQGGLVYYPDTDGDGFGDASAPTTCPEGEGFLTQGEDCDDGDSSVFPGADEHCNELDDDCDGTVDEDDALDAETWYQDADGDGWADEEVWLVACQQPSGYLDVSLVGDCDDRRGDVNPGEYEQCGDLTDNDCDGEASTCRLTGSVAWDAEQPTIIAAAKEHVEDGTGRAMAGGGDLTGDGIPDLLVGIQNRQEDPFLGEALVFPGPFVPGEELTPDDASATLRGSATGLRAGAAVAILGDIDGKGHTWIGVVAAPRDPVSGPPGTLYLLQTPVSDTLDVAASAERTLAGDSAAGAFATALSGGRDVVGDPYPDLLVGAPGTDGAAGAAYLFDTPISEYGGTGQAHATFLGEQAGDALGDAVALVKDVDGDGNDDLAIAAPEADDKGRVGLFFCPVEGKLTLADADRGYLGEQSGDSLGRVVSAGDTDGDGYADLLLAAPLGDHGSGAQGTVYLILGASNPTASLLGAEATIQGSYAGEQLGSSLAGLGDFDADGRDDVLLGAPGRDWPESDAGVAYLFYGAFSGALSSNLSDAILEGPSQDAACATALAAPGDLNQDGFTDALLGAPGGNPAQIALRFGQGW